MRDPYRTLAEVSHFATWLLTRAPAVIHADDNHNSPLALYMNRVHRHRRYEVTLNAIRVVEGEEAGNMWSLPAWCQVFQALLNHMDGYVGGPFTRSELLTYLSESLDAVTAYE